VKIRNLCVIVILLTTVSLVSVEGTTVSRLFNSNQIEDALQKRATYFSTTKITFDSMPISNWNKTRKENALQSINANPEAESPWYHLLNGFIENSNSDSVRDAYFNEALSIANEDAGTTWLLFLEFLRNNETIWYERSLEQLEKLMFLSGASSSKLLSQQLLHIALVQENFRNKNIAEIFYSWAHRFNKNESISIHRRFWINFPRRPDQCFKYSATYFHQLKKTWPMQLELSKALYAWFRMIFIFFALSIVLTLLVKNLPTSLHSLADKMPSGVNLTLKTILISATAGSFVFLGLYPFLWASAFLIHNQITLKDKKFLFLALVILTLAPFDTFFQNCLNRAANPEKPLLIFSQAITEGRSESLYKSALQNSQNDNPPALGGSTSRFPRMFSMAHCPRTAP
jgi:hypothetical protein